MAEALDKTNKNDLFRNNAAAVGVTSVSAIGEKLQKIGKPAFAQNDPRIDPDDERDEFGRKRKRKKFELAGNSDEAQLARASGNFNVGETFEESKLNPVNVQHAAEVQAQKAVAFQQESSFFQSAYDTAGQWYDDYIANPAREFYDGACKMGNDALEWITDAGTNAWEGVKGAYDTVSTAVSDVGVAIADGYNNYIAQPVAKAWDATKEMASNAGAAIADGYNNYIAQPAAKAWDATKEMASNAGTTISNAASSMATSVSNTASSIASSVSSTVSNTAARAGATISSGWASLKNAVGLGTPEQTQTAEQQQKPTVVQTLAQPEEKPAGLVGEKNDVRPGSAPSLGSAFGSAVAGPAQVVDATPAPAPRPVPAPAPATMPM